MAVSKSIQLVRSARKTVLDYKVRPKDYSGRPGGLVKLTSSAPPIIVGDLHANLANFKAILDHDNNYSKIKKEQATLILLGDTVHNDMPGTLKEMDSSISMLDFVFELFKDLGTRLIYIRGNHDTFDSQLIKSGILQGLEFEKLLLRERGEEYVHEVREFFDVLPVFLIAKNFIISHAGPVRGGADVETLINIREDDNKYLQLQWNRVNEFRGTVPSNKEYNEEDIKDTLKKLELPEDTYFIVGHNPLWNNGNKTGVWQDVMGIKNHIILYSGGETLAPYITFDKSGMVVKFAIQAKAEAYYR
jgi:hypothetical protein